MMKKKYSTRRLEAIRTTAKASKYIAHINDLEPGPVVLCVRVSSVTQKDNLLPQRINLEWEVEKRGFWIVAVFEEIASGREEERIGFERAILEAQSAGAVVVAESVDRFRRSWFKRDARLSVFEMNRLM